MTRLIVNNTDTTPGIFFPFQSITVRDARGKKKVQEPVATVNDFVIVIRQSLREPIIKSTSIIWLRAPFLPRVSNDTRHIFDISRCLSLSRQAYKSESSESAVSF